MTCISSSIRIDRGHDVASMGDQLPTLDLGSDFEPVQLTLGWEHSCALSRQGMVKCWGKGAPIGLAKGWQDIVGLQSGEMGDFLPALALAGEAVQIAAGAYHTCAAGPPAGLAGSSLPSTC